MTIALEIVFWVSVGIVVYTYLGYPLLLSVTQFFCRRQASAIDDDYLPSVSVILAAYNEVDCIAEKIKNCLALQYPSDRIEILIGSDASDDGTDEIVRRMEGRRVRFFPCSTRSGKTATVNRLVREATGEVCVFSDVSELFDPDAARKLVRHFADQNVGLATGNHIYNRSDTELGTGTSFYWKFKRFLQSCECRLYSGCTCDGTIYACRRTLFPFPPDNTINDDIAIPWGILSAGKRIVYEPRAIIRGDVLKETNRFFRQKIRSQAGKYQNFLQFPQLFVPWPLRRWLIVLSHGVLPTLVPWFMMVAWLANCVLAFSGSFLYQVMFALQMSFYLAALFGYLAERMRWHVGVVAIPFYFVTANLGSLCGFVSYSLRIQRAAWRKVE